MKRNRILFVHGLGLSGVVWEPLHTLIEGFDWAAPDLPGHGRESPCYRAGQFDATAFWSRCFAEDDWNCVVVHSAASALLPELLGGPWSPHSVVLLEGNLLREDAEWSESLVKKDAADYDAWLVRFRRSANVALRMGLQRQACASEVDRWASGFRRVSGAALLDFAKLAATRTQNGMITESLQTWGGPVLYLRGAFSPLWSGWSRLAEAGIGHGVIDGAGHHLMLDAPAPTWTAIMAFLTNES